MYNPVQRFKTDITVPNIGMAVLFGAAGVFAVVDMEDGNLVNTNQLPIEILIERMSTAPARLYGLSAGTLSEGAPADLVIFDAGASWTVGAFASKSSNSPFAGHTLKGAVCYTIVDGKVVFMNRALRSASCHKLS